MRIVFLCTSSLVEASPRGRWLPIGAQLAKQGHEVHLLLLHPLFDTVTLHRFQQDGVHIAYVDQMHVYGYSGQRTFFGPLQLLRVALKSSLSLAWAALRLQPDVLHIAKPQPMNGLAGLLLRPNMEFFLDCDDYETETNRFSGGWQQWVVRWWDDHLPKLARAVSVNTRFSSDRCRDLGISPERIFYVPNGISDWQCQRPPDAYLAALRQSINLEHHPVIIYAGDMCTVARGIGLLLESFAALVKRLPSARLLMVGNGDDRTALQEQAKRMGLECAIRWTGRVSPNAVRMFLALSDCSVDPVYDTPATRARSPLKIFESLGLGVPVVTGDVGDRREILANGNAGVLVQPGCAESLAEGLERVLTDQSLHRDLVHQSLQQREHYRWEKLVPYWMKMYE